MSPSGKPEAAQKAIRFDNKRTGIPVEEPSALRSHAILTLHTRQAQHLVHGRRAEPGQRPIYGLMRWAAGLRQIWTGAAADDPYAQWSLVQIEDALQTGDEILSTLQARMDAVLKSVPAGFHVDVAQASEPYQVDVQFASPHAYQGTFQLAAYDRLVCAILTARHIGLIDRPETERLLDKGGKVMRRLFSLGLKYRYTGVTREELQQGTKRAQRALEAMGELPQIILSRELQPMFCPEPRKAAPEPERADPAFTGPGFDPGMALRQHLMSKVVDVAPSENVDEAPDASG